MERGLPCEDGEEKTPKEQTLSIKCGQNLVIQDEMGKVYWGKIMLGPNSLLREFVQHFILTSRTSDWKPQMGKKNNLNYLKSSLAALWRMNSREAGPIRKSYCSNRGEAGSRTWPQMQS